MNVPPTRPTRPKWMAGSSIAASFIDSGLPMQPPISKSIERDSANRKYGAPIAFNVIIAVVQSVKESSSPINESFVLAKHNRSAKCGEWDEGFVIRRSANCWLLSSAQGERRVMNLIIPPIVIYPIPWFLSLCRQSHSIPIPLTIPLRWSSNNKFAWLEWRMLHRLAGLDGEIFIYSWIHTNSFYWLNRTGRTPIDWSLILSSSFSSSAAAIYHNTVRFCWIQLLLSCWWSFDIFVFSCKPHPMATELLHPTETSSMWRAVDLSFHFSEIQSQKRQGRRINKRIMASEMNGMKTLNGDSKVL